MRKHCGDLTMPDSAMMLEEQLKTYRKQGYLLIKGLFPLQTVTDIVDEAKSLFDLQMDRNGIVVEDMKDEAAFLGGLKALFESDYEAFLGAAKLCQHMLSLQRMGLDPKITENVQWMGLRHPTMCVKPILYFNSRYLAKTTGHYKTPPHQDWRSMQGSLDSMVVWVPLVDINQDLGALEVIPGSHLKGLQESVSDEWYRTLDNAEYSDSDFVPVEVEAGDALFFSSFLVHRSGNNITDRIRWSVHFRYNNALEPSFIERRFPHPYVVYRPQQELVTPGFATAHDLQAFFQEEQPLCP
jgi:ectoine hydroxylase-related dioxygenase (phytanoyl-CoA dioxygenase family)